MRGKNVRCGIKEMGFYVLAISKEEYEFLRSQIAIL